MYFAKEPSKKYKSIALNSCRSGINDSLSQALCKCTDWVSFKRIWDEECETLTITWMFVTQTVKDDKQLDWWNWLDDTSRYFGACSIFFGGTSFYWCFSTTSSSLTWLQVVVSWTLVVFNMEFFKRCCQLAVRQHYRNLWINVEIFE